MESPFDVLLVDDDADDEEIEQAYRRRVKEAHPDQGGSVEEFQAVRRAYERIQAGYEANGSAAEANGTAAGADVETSDFGAADGRSNPEPEPERAYSEVEYLNYDVLSDFGWEPGDDDLFGKAAAADLDEVDYGAFEVHPGESLLEAAEDRGFAWPFACRGGACANCAVLLLDGELSMPASHVLPEELMERGFRLSCNGMPITDELKVVYNVKHMPELDDLLLPPQPFENAYPDR
ncbi:2Fe-2S iron-sulfur cluster-binding protein [Halorussus limi]|uniref:2Fe-2S iron-sulfur cluster-binding protein n=1 Tax=Halorussus limi TaxID=2938695 RepID=A0A8U0I024_9EURY|nr:ferredoxin Fer [Halorussus limi]UPV76154.1 2Fe-2S iron-sulfur cluster-binding protein [Halorussus limi]